MHLQADARRADRQAAPAEPGAVPGRGRAGAAPGDPQPSLPPAGDRRRAALTRTGTPCHRPRCPSSTSSPMPAGGTVADALRNTVDLARRAEQFGYHRYWLAEHHFAAGVASAAPAVLIGQVAAATSAHPGRLRRGAGRPPTALSVVEQFGILDALYPGRIDLGLGRSGQRQAEAARELAAPTPAPTGARVVDGLLHPAAVLLRPARRRTPVRPRHRAAAAAGRAAARTSPSSSTTSSRCCAATTGTPTASTRTPCRGRGRTCRCGCWAAAAGRAPGWPGRGACRSPPTTTSAPRRCSTRPRRYRAAFRPSAALAEPYVVVSADVRGRRRPTPRRVGWPARTGRGCAASVAATARSRSRAPSRPSRLPWTDDDRQLVADRVDTQFVGAPRDGRGTAAHPAATSPAPTSCWSPRSPTTTPTGCAPTSCWPRSGPSPATPAGPDSTTARSPWPGRGPRIRGVRVGVSRHRAEQSDLRAQVPSRPNASEVGTPPSPWRAGLY